jgi:hypothetical protein
MSDKSKEFLEAFKNLKPELQKPILEICEHLLDDKPEKQESIFWEPNRDEKYYPLCLDRQIATRYGGPIKPELVKTGMVFKTARDGDIMSDYLAAVGKLKRIADVLNGDHVFDWRNFSTHKYYIYLRNGKLNIDYNDEFNILGLPYFKSRELAEKAISLLTPEEIEILTK